MKEQRLRIIQGKKQEVSRVAQQSSGLGGNVWKLQHKKKVLMGHILKRGGNFWVFISISYVTKNEKHSLGT